MAKLIAIEGIDCVGKATQTNLLKNYLESKGYKVYVQDFPRYNTPIGALIKEVLMGTKKVAPTAFHTLYEADRYDFVETFDFGAYDFLILDRFTLSNFAFAIPRGIEYDLIDNMQSGLPMCNLTLLLDLPASESIRRKNDKYSTEEIDINERDLKLQIGAGHAYRDCLCTLDYGFVVDASKSVEQVHAEIIGIVNKRFGIDCNAEKK